MTTALADDEPETLPPPAPDTLGASGRALWERIVADFEPRPDEERLLLEAAATADLVDRLAAALDLAPLTVEGSAGQMVANPLLNEVRQARHQLAGLLRGLGLTDDGDEVPRLTPSEAGRRAARARWDRQTAPPR